MAAVIRSVSIFRFGEFENLWKMRAYLEANEMFLFVYDFSSAGWHEQIDQAHNDRGLPTNGWLGAAANLFGWQEARMYSRLIWEPQHSHKITTKLR